MRATRHRTSRGPALRGLLITAVVLLALPVPVRANPYALAESVEDLLGRFRAMPGFAARFEEEKRVALLSVALRSSGQIFFAPPNLLVRRVDEPNPSVLVIESEALVFTDATGTERFDLGANATARAFAHTFADILAGDLPRLRKTYEITFEPERPVTTANPERDGAWRLRLVPRDPALARGVSSIDVRGAGLILQELAIHEGGGEKTVMRFQDVDPARRLEATEVEQLKRLPKP